MSNFFTAIGVAVIAIPLVLGLAILGIAWRSWWLYPAWGWFIVPLGVPAIRFWHFAALLLFIDTLKTIHTKKDDRETEWGSIVLLFLWPIAAWWMLRWMR